MPEPISLTSEIERMRASGAAAHRYAERCDDRTESDRKRMALANLQLLAIVSACADISRQLTRLEQEILEIADVLVT